jgi:hypothetical protein
VSLLERFRKPNLSGNISSYWQLVPSRLVSQFPGDLQSGSLKERCELSQTSHCHAHHRRGDAEAGIHHPGVVPNGRCNAAYVEFVLLQIAGVAGLSDPGQFSFQFLKIPHCVRRQALQPQLGEDAFPLILWHVSQHDLAHCGAIKWHGGADAGVDAQLFRRIQFLDVNRGQPVTHRQMNGLARLPIQFPKVRQTHPANVELAQRCVADGETCDSKVVHAIPAAVQKAGSFQVRQETVDRAHRQPGAVRYLFCGQTMPRFAEKLQQAQPALQRSDVVVSLWSICHAL